jgi:hypothetical protein
VLFSRWAGTQLPWFHYGAPFVPLVIGGALEATSASSGSGPEVPIHRAPAVVIGGAVAAALLFGPLSPRAPDSVRLWSVLRPDATVDYAAAVDAVRSDDAVSATNRALSHLMHRDHAYLFPLPFTPIHGTYPAGLETPPSRSDARDVDVVIVEPKGEAAARAQGFATADPATGLFVGRR